MCPVGDVCALCGDAAVVEIHWPSWVMKLCELHGTLFYNEKSNHTHIFILGADNATTSVN